MSPFSLFLNLLNLVFTSFCVIAWLGVIFYLWRWNALCTASDMQSRLQAWTTENGYRIVKQERPEEAPLMRRISLSGPFRLPSHCLWTLDPQGWGFRQTVRGSTCLTVLDHEGRLRRGRFELARSRLLPLAAFELGWDEAVDVPPLLEPVQSRPQDDPLWDPWTDSPSGHHS
jgi:hypothetical protein